MARKHHKPEEIGALLRQVEVLVGQGKPAPDAVRAIGVTEATYYRWRSEFGGLKLDQVRRLQLLEQENGRLRQAVADLTLGKLVRKEAASGSWSAPLLTTKSSQGRRRACVEPVTAKLGVSERCLPGAGSAPFDAAQSPEDGRRRPCDDLVVRKRR